jgi:hypothetical protein
VDDVVRTLAAGELANDVVDTWLLDFGNPHSVCRIGIEATFTDIEALAVLAEGCLDTAGQSTVHLESAAEMLK